MTRFYSLAFFSLTTVLLTGCGDPEEEALDSARYGGYRTTHRETRTEYQQVEPQPAVQIEEQTTVINPAPTTRTETTVTTTAPGTQAKKDYPYGTPVAGKPGYVTSPHAPTSGFVDVRGYPPGTEVKDPYTQKIFLVP